MYTGLPPAQRTQPTPQKPARPVRGLPIDPPQSADDRRRRHRRRRARRPVGRLGGGGDEAAQRHRRLAPPVVRRVARRDGGRRHAAHTLRRTAVPPLVLLAARRARRLLLVPPATPFLRRGGGGRRLGGAVGVAAGREVCPLLRLEARGEAGGQLVLRGAQHRGARVVRRGERLLEPVVHAVEGDVAPVVRHLLGGGGSVFGEGKAVFGEGGVVFGEGGVAFGEGGAAFAEGEVHGVFPRVVRPHGALDAHRAVCGGDDEALGEEARGGAVAREALRGVERGEVELDGGETVRLGAWRRLLAAAHLRRGGGAGGLDLAHAVQVRERVLRDRRVAAERAIRDALGNRSSDADDLHLHGELEPEVARGRTRRLDPFPARHHDPLGHHGGLSDHRQRVRGIVLVAPPVLRDLEGEFVADVEHLAHCARDRVVARRHPRDALDVPVLLLHGKDFMAVAIGSRAKSVKAIPVVLAEAPVVGGGAVARVDDGAFGDDSRAHLLGAVAAREAALLTHRRGGGEAVMVRGSGRCVGG
mmetsp:Transcript_13385/g.30277  ORF Transcript_13385/g.30277 Transcript_13385/m.30277 type:complete len:529 (+) Transcript_13385:383-1969(+)